MMKLKVLLPTHPSRDSIPDHLPEYKQFLENFDVRVQQYEDSESLKQDLLTKYNDISGMWLSSALIQLGSFNQYIDYFPPTLKVVAFPWVGASGFDYEAFRAKGIDLCNIGDVAADDVADIALSLTISAFRFTSIFERELRDFNGNITEARKIIGSIESDEKGRPVRVDGADIWTKRLFIAGNQMESPRGRIAGIVGLGFIGKAVAKRLDAIGMRIRYTKRTPLTESEKERFPFELEYVPSFEELIPSVDLIVLAVPHSPETTNLINRKTLKLVKKGVRIVNIGRGSAIDEDALFEALDEGVVNSVGLDVFLNEPNIDKRFLNRPNVTALPHLGSFTVDNFRDSAIITMNNIRKVLNGDKEGVPILN